ncbi:type I-E CRISPR-associated protein Cas7/Cse4/CasC [Corynebacterium pygosceleis]|uniref:Type I-E CRISPR-associated protein Cas7/Cse4/CasC n=1 Tax=Corynebacterium pygosceleis TaxID=2800406 RepID=A0ABT3WWV5_9CORY|nr:type I-E CRISPR-associated protein Cas7/Cse4/CasC [Corynebacterium pygosceleis]MCK7676291.1 type I-E CRISPR-associated protein Cas7/Cse4/CasC [Corynebacterium pygosceleis]MCL0121550.1 type I-E CRISPR-associated protein Cas7/Cse4/CasC [Corynebacterium pygosceleis]MCX7445700.1 type I-E CRISPR-associated protein Cas7/Cse4/CasC [Corynebacterium pygosceleis]
MTSQNLYLDIHIIQSVPPSCINRDDTGSPKTAFYGGVRRSRVSSQAWKRAARANFKNHLNTDELGERTVVAVNQIATKIRELRPDIEKNVATDLAVKTLTASGIKVKEPKAKKDENQKTTPVTGYLLFLSRRQITSLARLGLDSHDSGKAVTKKAAQAAVTNDRSIDIALFGRMITDAPELNSDATCQVAHALSVHPAITEFDYFTASDDNKTADTAAAEMIGTVEFTSSTLYRYATINVPALVEQLGSLDAACRAVEAFIACFTLSMPTGKQNTFGNRTRPELIMVSLREDQPVNFVGAFEDAIRSTSGYGEKAAIKLAEHATEDDRTYGTEPLAVRYVVSGSAATEPAKKALDEYGTSGDFREIMQFAVDSVKTRLGSQE